MPEVRLATASTTTVCEASARVLATANLPTPGSPVSRRARLELSVTARHMARHAGDTPTRLPRGVDGPVAVSPRDECVAILSRTRAPPTVVEPSVTGRTSTSTVAPPARDTVVFVVVPGVSPASSDRAANSQRVDWSDGPISRAAAALLMMVFSSRQTTACRLSRLSARND